MSDEETWPPDAAVDDLLDRGKWLPPPPEGYLCKHEGKHGKSLPNGKDHANEDKAKSKTDNDLVVTVLPHLSRTRIPPRQWAYGSYMLFGSAAVLGAVDGGGKGAQAVVMALAMITGRPLLGEKIWRPGSVAIVSYEDNDEEWHRRIAAACEHYGVDYDLVLDNIYFIHKKTDRVCFVRMGDNDIVYPDGDIIIDTLREIGVALLIIDPFNHAHGLEDGNNNVMMAKVAAEVSRVAEISGAAVLVLHHLRKGASGQIDDLMGATSLRATFRSTRILAGMTQEEAKKLHINTKDYWRYSRIAGSKENYAPPPDTATWFKLESVDLGNADDDYPAGDNVQVTVTWKPPPVFEGMGAIILTDIFDQIRRGPVGEHEAVYAPVRQAKHWVGSVIVEIADKSPDQAAKIVKIWLENKVLVAEEYNHREQKRKVSKVVVNEVKVAEMLSNYASSARNAEF